MNRQYRDGFTLIELSIVLIIIGLIVGGILVGQDLVKAAAVRAEIAQIDKYNSAVHAFQNKYGFLPGDMPDPYATNFGFQSRGPYAGEGNGNGLIEGQNGVGAQDYGTKESQGETVVFWVDLSTANMVDGGFGAASPTVAASADLTLTSSPAVGEYLPQAKIGNGNYVYVWSGGWGLSGCCGIGGDSQNYFGLSAVTAIGSGNPLASGRLYSTPGLTVQQAYNIDKKIDDGLPQTGSVTALYVNGTLGTYANWAAGGGGTGASSGSHQPTTTATPQTSTTCYDNGGASGAMQYSLGSTTNNGANLNCALSFKFQ